MKIDDKSRIIWIVSVNCWTGEVTDLEIRVISKNLVIGSTSNGNGITEVTLYPTKSEYEECGLDKRKVIDVIKERYKRYEEQILRYTYGVSRLSY